MSRYTFGSVRAQLEGVRHRFDVANILGWTGGPYSPLGPAEHLIDTVSRALEYKDHFGYKALGLRALLDAADSVIGAEIVRQHALFPKQAQHAHSCATCDRIGSP